MTIDRTIVLLLVAVLVALLARRLRLPYTVGLVLAGIGLTACVRVGPGRALTPHLITEAFLPPLLFEAALSLRWRDLRRDGVPLCAVYMGVVGVGGFGAGGMVYLAHWPPTAALLFGVLIAATDPVSVIATFKENKIHGRLRLLVEAESLFNDGVAAVFFALALDAGPRAAADARPAPWELLRISLGGIVDRPGLRRRWRSGWRAERKIIWSKRR